MEETAEKPSTIGSARARQLKTMMPSSTGGTIKDMGMVRDSSAIQWHELCASFKVARNKLIPRFHGIMRSPSRGSN